MRIYVGCMYAGGEFVCCHCREKEHCIEFFRVMAPHHRGMHAGYLRTNDAFISLIAVEFYY